MKEIITNEFIAYKSGFIQGHSELMEAIKCGKLIDLNAKEERLDNWYTYGEEDAINYYGKRIDDKIELDQINTKEAVRECFSERVIRINEEQGKEIPIGKFRI